MQRKIHCACENDFPLSLSFCLFLFFSLYFTLSACMHRLVWLRLMHCALCCSSSSWSPSETVYGYKCIIKYECKQLVATNFAFCFLHTHKRTNISLPISIRLISIVSDRCATGNTCSNQNRFLHPQQQNQRCILRAFHWIHSFMTASKIYQSKQKQFYHLRDDGYHWMQFKSTPRFCFYLLLLTLSKQCTLCMFIDTLLAPVKPLLCWLWLCERNKNKNQIGVQSELIHWSLHVFGGSWPHYATMTMYTT